MASPWLHFMNFAFSTGSASLAVPNEGLGFALGAWITDNVYVLANISDANAIPSEPGKTFGRFFSARQYFKSFELGWSAGRERAYFDNVHATLWHTDASQEHGTPSGWGIAASGTYYVADKVLPFVRGGYSKDAGTLLQGSVSAGVGWQPIQGQDLLGFAFNWGRPNPTTFGSGLRDQYTFELFYRLQVAHELAITPDVQLLIHPALNQDVNVVWVFGLRMRLAL